MIKVLVKDDKQNVVFSNDHTLSSLSELQFVDQLHSVNPIVDDIINVECTTKGATQIGGSN